MNQMEYEALAQRTLHPKTVTVYLYLKYQLILKDERANSCQIDVHNAIKKTACKNAHSFMSHIESLEDHGLVCLATHLRGGAITIDFPLVFSGNN